MGSVTSGVCASEGKIDMSNGGRATFAAAFLVLFLSTAPANAGVAYFDGLRDSIRVSGQTVIGTASTYEAVILFLTDAGTFRHIFNEWTNGQEDKVLAAGPNWPMDTTSPTTRRRR